MTKRTLSLKREALSELSTDDLTSVVGGAPKTLVIRECLPSQEYSCIDCITHGHGCTTS